MFKTVRSCRLPYVFRGSVLEISIVEFLDMFKNPEVHCKLISSAVRAVAEPRKQQILQDIRLLTLSLCMISLRS